MYETGGMRRTHLQKRNNILKRLLFHAVGFNLALLLRECYGIGKPRTLQGNSGAISLLQIAMVAFCGCWTESVEDTLPFPTRLPVPMPISSGHIFQASTTGC